MLKSVGCRPVSLLALLSATLLCTLDRAWADRGSIRSEPVNIEEPAQRAIIVHNGVREWLILQTDVRAEKTTRIVEFMPLPAKPEVSLAPEGCFAALKELVEKHKLSYASSTRTGGGKVRDEPDEAVQIVVEAQLGPHAVTVAEVKDADAFVAWVREFCFKNGLGEPALTSELREVVNDYLSREFRFFAFDVVTLTPEKQTVQPLTYEFRSTSLYYPLLVTNLYGEGQGAVELFTFLPPGLAYSEGLRADKFPLRPRPSIEADRWRIAVSGTAKLGPEELDGLHPNVSRRMGVEKKVLLSAYKYTGPLRFERDVVVELGYREPRQIARRFLAAWADGDSEVLDALTSTPFVLADPHWHAVISGRDKLMAELAATKPPAGEGDYKFSQAFAREVPFKELTDRFIRDFIIEQLRLGEDKILDCTVGSPCGTYLVFVRCDASGFMKIAGLVTKERPNR